MIYWMTHKPIVIEVCDDTEASIYKGVKDSN